MVAWCEATKIFRRKPGEDNKDKTVGTVYKESMSRFLLIFFLLVVVMSAPVVRAVDGVQCALSVFQDDREQDREVLLYADTVDLLLGVEATGFVTALSLDLEVTSMDSGSVALMVHARTLAPQPGNYARNFQIEYGLPARLSDMVGKQGAQYSLVVEPLQPVDVDTVHCGYRHQSAEDFRFDPTANMDLYYVPNTLGDFHWNLVKGLLEEEYRRFARFSSFNLPGKYNMYLCPCRMYSVIWDKRFGMMADPTRRTACAIYATDFNSVCPFIINHVAVLYNYGYAPPFLSEGYANLQSLALWDMKKIKEAGKAIPLDSLLDTYCYLTADPLVADRTAAAFVRFLIATYQRDRFIEAYQQADDLNLREVITRVFGKSVAELEKEWLEFVDTSTVTIQQFGYYREQAEAMRDYVTMLEYARSAVALAETRTDSLTTLAGLVRSLFFNGDYYAAAEVQQQLVALNDTMPGAWMSLAAYRMMNGEYREATDDLARARGLDSTNEPVIFNQALNYCILGDTTRARELLLTLVNGPSGSMSFVESRVMLGQLMLASGRDSDTARATQFFQEVVSALPMQVHQHGPSPTRLMWLGICHLGLGNTQTAEQHLQTALFLETRPFYQGMIHLWLGKVADVLGHRQEARDHYGWVVANASAHYHQEEARAYLEAPYRR